MDESVKNYLLWLNERGLESYLPVELTHPAQKNEQPENKIHCFIGQSPEIFIAVHTQNALLNEMPNDEKLLLAKLVKAMELSFDKLVIMPVDGNYLEVHAQELHSLTGLYNIQKVVLFGSTLAEGSGMPAIGNAALSNGLEFLCTYSPNEMLNDEQLKRPTWEHLKLFLKK